MKDEEAMAGNHPQERIIDKPEYHEGAAPEAAIPTQ